MEKILTLISRETPINKTLVECGNMNYSWFNEKLHEKLRQTLMNGTKFDSLQLRQQEREIKENRGLLFGLSAMREHVHLIQHYSSNLSSIT